MLIRKAQEGDIDQLIKLCALHAAYEKASYSYAGKGGKLFKHLFVDKTVECLVVENQKELVGYATFLRQFSTWDADYYLYLDCLYLVEELRGQGVGTQLMDLIKSYAEEENCFQIQWHTPTFNKSAIAFYKKIGGVPKEKQRFFWD